MERSKTAPYEKRFRIGEKTYGADEILHVPAFGYDGLKGLSPIAQARQELGAAMAATEYLARHWSNNAHLGGVLQLPAGKTLSDERKVALRAQWRAMHNLANAGATAVLEDGMTWQAIGVPLKDLEFVAAKRHTVNEVATMFQVPPEMIGGDRPSSMTYSTVEGQALHFVKFSLARWLSRIEQALYHDTDLFPPGTDLYPKFSVEGILRGDSTTRAAFYKTMHEVKALSSEEIRDLEDYGPAKEGDTFAAPAAPAPLNGKGDPAAVPAPA